MSIGNPVFNIRLCVVSSGIFEIPLEGNKRKLGDVPSLLLRFVSINRLI